MPRHRLKSAFVSFGKELNQSSRFVASGMGAPSIFIVLLLGIIAQYIDPGNGAFTENNLRDPLVRRYGITACPDNIYFDSSSFDLSASSIVANGQACTSGELRVAISPERATSGGELAEYLSASPGAGQVVGLDVVENIECPDVSFDDRAYFTLVNTDDNVTIDFPTVFSRNDTLLQAALASPKYTFVQGVVHVVINSICLYTELTTAEFDSQRGEACFPRGASVAMADGSVQSVENLRVGDAVAINDKKRDLVVDSSILMSTIIGWTHFNAARVSKFVHIVVQNGFALTVSPGHYVYADDRLVPARAVHAGMRMRMAVSPDSPAISITTVWRMGLYNPQTLHGDIIVDGFVCSTYTEAVPALTAHALLAPVRLANHLNVDILPWLDLVFSRFADDIR